MALTPIFQMLLMQEKYVFFTFIWFGQCELRSDIYFKNVIRVS